MMAQSMLDMSLDEILAAGRAGGGAALAGGGGGGRGERGGGARDSSRRGDAFASRFPRRLPISKRGGNSSFFGMGSSSYSRGRSWIGGDRGRGGRGYSSSYYGKWMDNSYTSGRGRGRSRWRGGNSSFGADSYLLSEEFDETEERGSLRGTRQQWGGRRRLGYEGNMVTAREEAAAAARTAADAAAEAAADAAGDTTMDVEDDGEREGRDGGTRRRWNDARYRENTYPMDDDTESNDIWENDRFGINSASFNQSNSSFNNRRRGGRGLLTAGGRGGTRYGGGSSRGFLRISNLDYTILEEDLKELFGAIGDVVKVWIDYDRTDRSKGTGGCIFRFLPDAERAIRIYEGKKIEGLPLHLELQTPAGASAAEEYNGVGGGAFRSYNAGFNSSYDRGGGYNTGRRGW